MADVCFPYYLGDNKALWKAKHQIEADITLKDFHDNIISIENVLSFWNSSDNKSFFYYYMTIKNTRRLSSFFPNLYTLVPTCAKFHQARSETMDLCEGQTYI